MNAALISPTLDVVDPVMELARAGDQQAFGVLYRRYALRIQRYIARRVYDPEVVADLTADVFLRAHRAVQAGKPWNESLVSWLYQIARHRIVDHIRFSARRPQCELSETLPAGDGEQLDDTIDWQLLLREVEGAMQRIRPDYARILRLRYLEDLSHAESGALLNRRASAVKVTHHRAVKALRKELAGNPVVDSLIGAGRQQLSA